jgi:hypothetical protein
MPLAPGQQTIWEIISCLDKDDPGAAHFTVVDIRRLDGELDLAVFQQALGDLTHRHHALRTVFATTGDDPMVRILPEISPAFDFTDLSATPEPERDEQLAAIVHRVRFRTFDLIRGPLWNVHLVRTGPAEHVMAVNFFHVISDGWACRVFVEDLVHAYRARLGRCDRQAPLNITFGDVTAMQHEVLAESAARDAYWRGRLLPLPGGRVFPESTPAPDADLTAEVRVPFEFPEEAAARLQLLAWRTRTTPFVTLLAAYVVALSRRTQRDRIVVGTTTLGRETPQARRIIGQFTNNIYIDAAIGRADTLTDVVRAVHARMTEANRNLTSFKRIAHAVNPQFGQCRPWCDNRLYDAWFQSAAPAPPELVYPELRVSPVSIADGKRPRGHAPLTAGDVGQRLWEWHLRWAPHVVIDDDRHGGIAIYNGDLYEDGLVTDWIADYRAVVTELAMNPGGSALSRPAQLTG